MMLDTLKRHTAPQTSRTRLHTDPKSNHGHMCRCPAPQWPWSRDTWFGLGRIGPGLFQLDRSKENGIALYIQTSMEGTQGERQGVRRVRKLGPEVKVSLRGQMVSFKLKAGPVGPHSTPTSSMEGILLAAPDMTGVWR